MEEKKIFCSFKDHGEIIAKNYCDECKLYMCNKCDNFHSKFHQKHKSYDLNNINISEIFTGFCKEKGHLSKLNFFCKTHNQLCCSECIVNIKSENLGKHKDCELYFIEDIKDELKNKLKDNIKYLEEISNNIQESVNNLKIVFEKINENKEEIKNNIQKLFTKLRNELNKREEELLDKIDKNYDESFCEDKLIKEIEKLPNDIKTSLEKGKILLKEENINELNEMVNDCLNVENNIKKIDLTHKNIEKCKNFSRINIKFFPEKDEEINIFIKDIQSFGNIINSNIINNYFEVSSIIKDDIEKQEQIIKWILEKTKIEEIKFELKFKMSINGFSNNDFYKYCENIGPSLTLIKTTKNKIFGGFTPLNFKQNARNIYDKSDQTFIFSLNLMKKYDMIDKDNKKAIYCTKDYGPCFGDSDFSLEENMKNGKTYANNTCNFLSNNNLELTGGKGNNENFEVEEFELYKVN